MWEWLKTAAAGPDAIVDKAGDAAKEAVQARAMSAFGGLKSWIGIGVVAVLGMMFFPQIKEFFSNMMNGDETEGENQTVAASKGSATTVMAGHFQGDGHDHREQGSQGLSEKNYISVEFMGGERLGRKNTNLQGRLDQEDHQNVINGTWSKLKEQYTGGEVLHSNPMNALLGKVDIESAFGHRTYTDKSGKHHEGSHDGIDLTMKDGSHPNINPSASGVVLLAEETGGYGNTVIIGHADGTTTLYAHLADINVKTGQMVDGDDTVGKMGNTGKSGGAHLHYEQRVGLYEVVMPKVDGFKQDLSYSTFRDVHHKNMSASSGEIDDHAVASLSKPQDPLILSALNVTDEKLASSVTLTDASALEVVAPNAPMKLTVNTLNEAPATSIT